MSTPAFTTRLEPLEAMAAFEAPWRALSAQSLEPNPFYAPEFLLAAARHLEKPGAIMALTVWRGAQLVGFLPLHRPNWREGMPFGVISAYWNPYVCLTVPLLEPGCAQPALLAMLEALDAHPRKVAALNFPMLTLHRPTGVLLQHLLLARHRPAKIISHYPRAALEPKAEATLEAYIEQEGSDVRKSIKRRQARLEGIGPLDHAIFREPGPARAQALQEFLDLEASGWKGRHRTALASRAPTRAFIEEAFAQERRLPYEIERLSVNGLPVAMSLNLLGTGVVHTFKQAYDETFRPYGPGKLLDRMAIPRVIGAPLRYDSCALPGYPIEAIWHEREVVAHKLVGLGNPPCARTLERLSRRAMHIQRLLRRLKRWRKALQDSSATGPLPSGAAKT